MCVHAHVCVLVYCLSENGSKQMVGFSVLLPHHQCLCVRERKGDGETEEKVVGIKKAAGQGKLCL